MIPRLLSFGEVIQFHHLRDRQCQFSAFDLKGLLRVLPVLYFLLADNRPHELIRIVYHFHPLIEAGTNGFENSLCCRSELMEKAERVKHIYIQLLIPNLYLVLEALAAVHLMHARVGNCLNRSISAVCKQFVGSRYSALYLLHNSFKLGKPLRIHILYGTALIHFKQRCHRHKIRVEVCQELLILRVISLLHFAQFSLQLRH